MNQQDQKSEQQQSAEERQAHWRTVTETWRRSGLSKAAFCRENDIGVWRLHYWVQRLGGLDGGRSVGFARVTPTGSGLHLVLPGGVRFEVEPGFDSATLKRFLAAIATSC